MADVQAEVELRLERGKTGLGFNIRGGTDVQHIPGDNGIYVTKIREQGAAAEDGRLKEGDKITEINGRDVTAVTHSTAVQHFLQAGNTVILKIVPGEEKRVRERLSTLEKQNVNENKRLMSLDEPKSAIVTSASFLLALGIVAGGIYVGYRYVKYSETPKFPSWMSLKK